MATHDYVIANGTGAAVRSDLNNALAAIVSNNSSSSEPSTTYAYQWWADTNANTLKMRNSANNAWITLRELDGTMLMEDGSVSTPGLAFADDLDTGFFRSASNRLNIATGGTERLELGSSEAVFNDPSDDYDFRVESNNTTHMLFVEAGTDRVGIGESDPDQRLHISEAASGTTMGVIIQNTATANDSDARLTFNTNSGGAEKTRAFIQATGNTSGDGNLLFATRKSGSTSESARIDSSGRLLVGRTSALNVGAGSAATAEIQNSANFNLSLISTINSSGAGGLAIGKARGGSVVQDDDDLGSIVFAGHDGTDFETRGAQITAQVDGTPGSNDMPGRLVFSTTSDGASSPTERLRIDSSGNSIQYSTGTLERQHRQQSSSSYTATNIRSVISGAAASLTFDTNTNWTNGNAVERMRLDSSGRLLAGVSSWSAGVRAVVAGNSTVATGNGVLSISRGTNTAMSSGDPIANIEFTNTSAATFARISVEADGTTGTTSDLPGRLMFWTTADGASSPTEKMRISHSGLSDIYGSSSTLRLRTGLTGTSGQLLGGFNGATSISTGTQSLAIFANGNIQNTNNSYGSLSDAKLKENVVDANSQWDDIKGIRVRNYNFIEGETHTQLGVVAQEVETVSPGLVTDLPDLDEEGNDLGTVTKSVNYSVLYMKAVKALQEAMDRIETLETKVAALEAG